ncbi:hypothetical protein IFM89_030410 [Coptis chinensis]|uniref:DUF4216 domain-containing protein n=1 Tax=Coptis chinensis TaxID=261450 RepID=A0A835HWG0_9MAGN|nr:hypothetical protein IFM89_030410 [Coptis chinensis]
MVDPKTIFAHLVRYGFEKSYTTWKYQIYLQGFKPSGRKRKGNTETPMSFIPWLREQLQNEEVSPIKRLVDGPNFQTISYNTYQANGYVFSTAEWDTNKTTQNSRIKKNAMTNFRASAKDKKIMYDDTTYYGLIRQILELDYFDFTITVFCCDWVRVEDKVNGCYTDPYINLTFVDLSKFKGSSKIVDEPFILASQASQVKHSVFLPTVLGFLLSVYSLKSIGLDMSGQESTEDHHLVIPKFLEVEVLVVHIVFVQ